MEVFFVTAVVTAMLVMTGILVNRNLKYKSVSSLDRRYLVLIVVVQAMVLVCDLLIEDQIFSRMQFDILLSVVCLSLLTSSLTLKRNRKLIIYAFIIAELILALYYLLCAAKVLPVPDHSVIRLLSTVIILVYICLFLYLIWRKVRDVQALMQSASVWAWLTFAVDVFYMLSVIIMTMLSDALSSSVVLMLVLALLMTGILMAYVYRINTDSAFALLHRHERTIVESMKISSADATPPGSNEEYVYKDVFARVQAYFEEEKPYLSGDLTINDVVAEVFSNKVYISRAISHCTGRNFCQYVNYHRVMYAVECYRNNTSLKVSELWPMCGFNTIVSFNMAFRLFMNENPSDWCRKEKMKLSRKRK